MGVVACTVYHGCRIAARKAEYRYSRGADVWLPGIRLSDSDILAKPTDMRYTINRPKDESVHTGHKNPPRDATSGGFSIPFCSRWLRPEAGYRLFISVQPFTDVIGDYTCHNRDNKRWENFHTGTPPSSTCMGAVACTVYHGCRIAARRAEYGCNDCGYAVYF